MIGANGYAYQFVDLRLQLSDVVLITLSLDTTIFFLLLALALGGLALPYGPHSLSWRYWKAPLAGMAWSAASCRSWGLSKRIAIRSLACRYPGERGLYAGQACRAVQPSTLTAVMQAKRIVVVIRERSEKRSEDRRKLQVSRRVPTVYNFLVEPPRQLEATGLVLD